MRGDRRLLLPLFAAVAVGVYFYLAPRFPKDQTVEIVLGDKASQVTEVSLTYEDPKTEWTSEVQLNYAEKQAPRVVHHESRMPSGDYKISMDVVAQNTASHIERNVSLNGGTTSIDISQAIHGIETKGTGL